MSQAKQRLLLYSICHLIYKSTLNLKIASSGREYIESYDWFALYGKGQHNIVEQWSFPPKKI